jgi:hypothetical protein
MKTCAHCQSIAFDDLDTCYECMHPFEAAADNAQSNGSSLDEMACFEIMLDGHMACQTYLRKSEGAVFSIGRAHDGGVIIPCTQEDGPRIDIFYSRGRFWMEERSGLQAAWADGAQRGEMQAVNEGERLSLGKASLSLVRT